MDTSNTIHLLKGTLKVKAHGYWYTSGGEKGAFGFYPHLKDREGYPIFPDTQLHGDLRMAAKWLTEIDPRFNKDIIIEIFGDEPEGKTRKVPSKVYLTDLTLSPDSKKKWVSQRLEVKPRISIDDSTRTVEKHMLVNMEMSYLEGLELEAGIYLGFFDSKDKLDEAKKLIESSVVLLSGFGQSRSRGYGRGEVNVTWKEEGFTYSPSPHNDIPSSFKYVLKNLVNLRNKPVHPGSTQFIESKRIIPAEKFKGWFINTYNTIFGTWPDDEQVSSISFPDLNPSFIKDEKNIIPGITPPMTTLKNEEGKIRDVAGQKSLMEMEDQENFFKTKTKPLSDEYFVTDSEPPLAFTVSTERRIRNQIGDGFATAKTQGLFVQELIHADTCFSGTITFKRTIDLDFLQRALFILKNIKPVIAGCIFEVVTVENAKYIQAQEGKFFLVTGPLPFSSTYLNYTSNRYVQESQRTTLHANIITLDTQRRYNTTLNRPKRPRIYIRPGSVLINSLQEADKKQVVSWCGFGKSIEEYKGKIATATHSGSKQDQSKQKFLSYVYELEKSITRAQLGFLKEFLNKKRDIKDIEKIARERREKYQEKNNKDWAALYGDIMKHIKEDPSGNSMRAFINAFLDEVFSYKWKEKGGGK
ncbi:MAG TPA: RAMP superfamily CRISPR-associated protein [Syntrophorhabdaceae bacterium]|nr:RAMP superfamily CRISPR-associated protein [Syntrophorhabdaceae bacterium]